MRKERKLGLSTVFLALFLAGDVIVFETNRAHRYAQGQLDATDKARLFILLLLTFTPFFMSVAAKVNTNLTAGNCRTRICKATLQPRPTVVVTFEVHQFV